MPRFHRQVVQAMWISFHGFFSFAAIASKGSMGVQGTSQWVATDVTGKGRNLKKRSEIGQAPDGFAVRNGKGKAGSELVAQQPGVRSAGPAEQEPPESFDGLLDWPSLNNWNNDKEFVPRECKVVNQVNHHSRVKPIPDWETLEAPFEARSKQEKQDGKKRTAGRRPQKWCEGFVAGEGEGTVYSRTKAEGRRQRRS